MRGSSWLVAMGDVTMKAKKAHQDETCGSIQRTSSMSSEPQERLQAMVKNYRPIEELIPAYWSEGDVFANDIRRHYYFFSSKRRHTRSSPKTRHSSAHSRTAG